MMVFLTRHFEVACAVCPDCSTAIFVHLVIKTAHEYAIPRPNCAMRPRSVTKCGRSHSGRTLRAVKWSRLPISGFRLFAGSFRREPISSPRRPWANRRQEGVIAMCPAGLQSSAARWLVENGPRELELLFRAIVYHPSVPILDRKSTRLNSSHRCISYAV